MNMTWPDEFKYAARRGYILKNHKLKLNLELTPRFNLVFIWCGWKDLNLHELLRPLGPEPSASANSATTAYKYAK